MRGSNLRLIHESEQNTVSGIWTRIILIGLLLGIILSGTAIFFRRAQIHREEKILEKQTRQKERKPSVWYLENEARKYNNRKKKKV